MATKANTGAAGGRAGLIAGNWKMHKTSPEASVAAIALLEGLREATTVGPEQVLICPTFTSLWAVGQALRGQSRVMLGAQDVHWEAHGAFTGEVSAAMLVDSGCSAVIIGHSERRALFAETDENVARKTAAALAAGLLPIVCVGETQAERAAGRTAEVLARQVRGAVAGLGAGQIAGLVFAYEPVWAIGTGLAAKPQDACEAAAVVRSHLPVEVREQVRVLYGGSVKTANVAEFMSHSEVDGVLVGGASLDGRDFAALAIAGLAACPR
jgi:triosephosphate isomerase (TIM)